MLIDDIKELQKKAGSYDTLKDEYDRLLLLFKDIRNTCDKVLGENKYFFAKRSSARSKSPYYETVYNIIKDEDFQASLKTLSVRFPELEVKTINNIMQKLKKYPDIESTKDGRELRLFYRKKAVIGNINVMG